MSDRSRLVDALLGSPIPPPNWRNERYAGSGWKSRRGRRAGRAYYISAREVQVELAEAGSHTNPPVIQGWAWLLALVSAAVEVLGLIWLHDGGFPALLMVVAPLPLWFAAVGAAAAISFDVDVRDDSVVVRSWLGEWFDRPGRQIGSIDSVRLVEMAGSHARLAGDLGEAVLSTVLWPTSSLVALTNRFARGRPADGRRTSGHRR